MTNLVLLQTQDSVLSGSFSPLETDPFAVLFISQFLFFSMKLNLSLSLFYSLHPYLLFIKYSIHSNIINYFPKQKQFLILEEFLNQTLEYFSPVYSCIYYLSSLPIHSLATEGSFTYWQLKCLLNESAVEVCNFSFPFPSVLTSAPSLISNHLGYYIRGRIDYFSFIFS